MSDEYGTIRPVIKPILDLFRSDCVAFWATTYNVDLAFFNEYLLRRLGDPPLNAVVLADQRRLDRSLEAATDRQDLLAPVNSRWLLRSVQLGAGRFHPKSYLTVNGRTAKLIVGSGNLSTNGIDAGRETFVAFQSGTPDGDAAILTWRAWVRRLVGTVDDTRLAERFADLETRLPQSTVPHVIGDTMLFHNLDAPIGKQLFDMVGSADVDELIVAAPFYDEHGEALGALVDRLRPNTVRLYTTSSTSVDGSALVSRLDGSGAQVEAFAYVPDGFTHAKLVGVIAGERAWIMSGSANLSHAALTARAGPGNVELVVVAQHDPRSVRAVFVPPDVRVEARPLASLASLNYDSADAAADPERPHRLLRGAFLHDGRIQITAKNVLAVSVLLADHGNSQPLSVEGETATTAGPLAGPLVHLVDADGTTLSNCIVVDDPAGLARVLQSGARSENGRPSELTMADLNTPLGRALEYMHNNMVMDVAERAPTAGTGALGADETTIAGDDSLWARLERETLARDPRAGSYARLLSRAQGTLALAEPIIELLDAMRHRVPLIDSTGNTRTTLQLLVIKPNDDPDAPGTGGGHQWSETARIRVRGRNVIRRYAAAQTDPRLVWIDPLAPLGNLDMAATVFVKMWPHAFVVGPTVELTADDLDDLWGRWIRPFVGTGNGDGWLDRTDVPTERLTALMAGDFVEKVTALCWLAIRPGKDHRERIVAWQPALRALYDRGLFDDNETVAEYLCMVTGRVVPAKQVGTDLLASLSFIDDELWCQQIAAQLGVGHLELGVLSAGQSVSVRLDIRGIDDPLNDPRLPQLVVATRQYRRTDPVALYAADHGWRVVLATGEPAAYLARFGHGEVVDSLPVMAGVIERIAAANGVLGDLFPAAVRVA